MTNFFAAVTLKGLNLFVVGCIEAAGTIVTSLDEAQTVLEGWC